MLFNYFKIAFRNLFKRKGYAFLNILGLVLGITCCLMIFQYVSYERSFDGQPPLADQIVRLRLDAYHQGKLSWQSATSYPAIAPTMKRDYPEVEDFCRLIDANILLSNDEKNVKYSDDKGYYADASFLRMFNVKLIKGDAKTALDAPDKMVVSQTAAKKYFGNDEPVGKSLVYRAPYFTRVINVTGVYEDLPVNSHLIIDHLISYSTLGAINRFYGDTSNATETNFGWYDFYSYIQLKKGTDLKKFEAKFPAFCDKYINSQDWAKKNNIKDELYAIPLRDIHLYSNYNQEAEVNGNGKAVGFIYLIAFIILVIAWINYINMATARSVERAREVGVRKVLGARRDQLVIQFLTESLLLNVIAFVLALAISFALTPAFNNMVGRSGSHRFFLLPEYWRLFSMVFLLGTFLSGLYPAFVLSGFQPVKVLKGLFKNSTSGMILRKGLIIAQFSVSVIMIVGTIIVFQQVKYMRSQDLGANISQTLVINGAVSVVDSVYQNIFQPFRYDVMQTPGVKNLAVSSSVPGKEIYWTNGVNRIGPDNPAAITLYHLGVDYDFIPAYNMQVLKGRNFSKEFGTDDKAVLLNETAVDQLGFKSADDAIDGKINRGGDTVKVIGVVKDFHQEGLRRSIEPLIVFLRPNVRNNYSIKVSTSDLPGTISALGKVWSKHFPNDPFDYFFLDEFFDQQYKSDKLYGKVFGLFASLAILIACFGLLGLSAYNIIQRTKEIGIRKVLGASSKNLLILLSRDFMTLVGIAFIIAIPVAWWIMNNWLQEFAYRIHIQWWVFAIAGVGAAMIALGTISYQAVKAIVANPVNSLRSE